jgi:hypothetical protein
MSHSLAKPGESSADKNRADAHHHQKGFIVFCETSLRYEKGFKAWIFLGPYLLGALGLETLITGHAKAGSTLGPWLGFLAYLILFPLAWRRILKLVALKKSTPVVPLG